MPATVFASDIERGAVATGFRRYRGKRHESLTYEGATLACNRHGGPAWARATLPPALSFGSRWRTCRRRACRRGACWGGVCEARSAEVGSANMQNRAARACDSSGESLSRENPDHCRQKAEGLMAVEITRKDVSAGDLRAAAARMKDGKAARRMLAIALVLEGSDRKTAAETCGMDRQTLPVRRIRKLSSGQISRRTGPSLQRCGDHRFVETLFGGCDTPAEP